MKKKRKTAFTLVLILCVIVILGIVSFLKGRVKMNSAGTTGNTAGNLNNGGLFCERDGKVFFANTYDGNALYSMNADGTDLRKLTVTPVSMLCADEHYIYYYQQPADATAGIDYVISPHGLYRASTSGKNVVCLTRDYVFNMQLVDNYIYYVTRGDSSPELRKLKIDKSENVLLAELAINPSCAVNGMFYFNGVETNHYLYAWNPQTDSSSVVWQGNIWNPIYDNGYIYYMDVAENYRLCRYSLSMDSVEILTHDRIDCYNIGGGYIYYQANSPTSPALKKMNLDGSNVEIVAEGNYTAIHMTSRYVYFQLFGEQTPIYQVPLGTASVSTFDAALSAAMKNIK